jgi:hypothetical protein
MKKAEIIAKLKDMYATLPETCSECPQLNNCTLERGDHCLILYTQDIINDIMVSCLSWDEFTSLQSSEVRR